LPYHGLHLGPVLFHELGGHGAGLDQREAHVPLRDLLTQRLAKAKGVDGPLCRVVDPGPARGRTAGGRTDVDDVGNAPRSVFSRAEQMRQSCVRTVQQAFDIDAQHAVPLIDGRVDDRPEQHYARIVDEDIEPAELGNGLLDGPARPGLCGEVGVDDEALSAADLRCELLEPVAAGGDRHAGAVRGKGAGGCSSDAGARPRDESDRVLERLSHSMAF
jgi:hypothetical protein